MDVVLPAPPARVGPPPNAFLVGFAGLLLPGLGQVVAGRPGKGFFYFCVVGAAFTAGLWMTGLVAVNPDRDPLWFAGQLLAGLPTLGVWQATKELVPTERLATFDLGMLYTGVAGLLNVIAIADALGIVEDRIAEADMRRRTADAEARAAAEALAAAATPGPGAPAGAGAVEHFGSGADFGSGAAFGSGTAFEPTPAAFDPARGPGDGPDASGRAATDGGAVS